MPPLITVLLVGTGAYLGYRLLSQKGENIARELKKARNEFKRRASGEREIKDLGTLRRDPETGDYTPENNKKS